MNDKLEDRLRKLADFPPSAAPVISLYLDLKSSDRGRSQFEPWVRKELAARGRTFDPKSEASQSFQADRSRIESWLADQLNPTSKGVAIFACSGADGFFETIELEAPFNRNELHVQDQPHLYPLARLIDQYPRYAAVIADTNSARIVVFGLNRMETGTEVQNVKTNRSMVGGWSQARYQRHIDNFHMKHAKEVIDALERIVREEGLQQFVLAGDQEVVIPLLKEQMPKHLSEKTVNTLRLDSSEPNHVVLAQTMDALRAFDTQQDASKVETLIGEYRSGGLAVVGVVDTLDALENGQVDELILSAASSALDTPEEALALVSKQTAESETDRGSLIADLLVTKAKKTAAKLSFVENPELLAPLGGCGAILRYKMGETMPKKGNYNHDYYKVRGKEPGHLANENQKTSSPAMSSTPKAAGKRKTQAPKATKKRTKPEAAEPKAS
jgi:peptide chain release factor subunit 1